MQNFRLHFRDASQPDYPLSSGFHSLCPERGAVVACFGQRSDALIQFRLDRSGLWLRIPQDARSVHVNGRPVKNVAWLRAGDAIHVDRVEVLVLGTVAREAIKPKNAARYDHDPRLLLRGLSGVYHGRSIALGPVRVVARSPDADIRIDAAETGTVQARLSRHKDKVLLQDLGSSEPIWVNGTPVRDAVLSAGDQIVFSQRYRFVVESPVFQEMAMPSELDDQFPDEESDGDSERRRRWPWLLLTAVLLGLLLSVLFWFGVR